MKLISLTLHHDLMRKGLLMDAAKAEIKTDKITDKSGNSQPNTEGVIQ